MNVYINSLEYSLPARVVTNFDLEKCMDTNDEWIRTRTGIHERRFINDNESGLEYAIQSATKALQSASIQANDISHIFVATCSPHMLMPSMACTISGALGITNKNVFSLDINAACSGFVYGIELVKSIVKADANAKVLFITSEILSRKINLEDRTTAILFGDGASAAIISAKSLNPTKEFLLVDSLCCSDGTLHDLITLGGGTSKNSKVGDIIDEDFFIQMQGREVYKHAVRSMSQSCIDILERNSLKVDDLSYVVPHQANIRIIEAVSERLQVPTEKLFTNVHKYGNTSASSIPIALCELRAEKDIRPNDAILLTSFGAGLAWGSILLKKL